MPYSKTTDQLSSKTKDNTQNTTQSSLNTSRLCRLRIRLRNINESSLKYESYSKKTHLYSKKTHSTHSYSKTKEYEVMFMPFQKRAISKTTKLYQNKLIRLVRTQRRNNTNESFLKSLVFEILVTHP